MWFRSGWEYLGWTIGEFLGKQIESDMEENPVCRWIVCVAMACGVIWLLSL